MKPIKLKVKVEFEKDAGYSGTINRKFVKREAARNSFDFGLQALIKNNQIVGWFRIVKVK